MTNKDISYAFSKWWDKITNGSNQWTSLERLAARDAYEEAIKSRDAEIERLRNIVENMPAKYIPESYWKAKP